VVGCVYNYSDGTARVRELEMEAEVCLCQAGKWPWHRNADVMCLNCPHSDHRQVWVWERECGK